MTWIRSKDNKLYYMIELSSTESPLIFTEQAVKNAMRRGAKSSLIAVPKKAWPPEWYELGRAKR